MEKENDPRDVALKRYAMVVAALDESLCAGERRRIRNEILCRAEISDRTFRRWVQAYNKHGFDALIPRRRKDKGTLKAVAGQKLDAAIVLKKEEPGRSTERILQILEHEGTLEKGEVSRSTIDRHFRRMGVNRKELGKSNTSTGRRFVRNGRNTLWQSDYPDFFVIPTFRC